jgi:hypothetical protein
MFHYETRPVLSEGQLAKLQFADRVQMIIGMEAKGRVSSIDAYNEIRDLCQKLNTPENGR